MTEIPDAQREEKIVEGCQLSASAPQRAKQGERILSLDELTGVQAYTSRRNQFLREV